MELRDFGEVVQSTAKMFLYRMGKLVLPQVPLPLGFTTGDAVHVWSNLKSRWIEDGIVQERTDTEKVVNGARLPAGSLKVCCEGGALVQWVLPPQARDLLRKVPMPMPRLPLRPTTSSISGADGMLHELRGVEQHCVATRQQFVDRAFHDDPRGRALAWLRPREVDLHGGARLCPEAEVMWSLFEAPRERLRQPPNIDWRLFRGAPRSDDVKQGELGDCWFLSSLAVLAEFQGGRFIRALLPDQAETSEFGAYMVRLCVGGMWRGVLIDDRFPATGGSYFCTQFAYCQTLRLQLWASLIEKAFAKVCGSFKSLQGGEAAEAIEVLTGWPSTLYIHGFPDFDPEVLWAMLSSSRDFEFLMICSTRQVFASGLESDHVYSLMDVHEINVPSQGLVRLLKIRNPNTKSKWQGDWSDKSSLWTPQLRSRLGCPEQGVPHTFFISYDDFLKHFAHCTICKIRSNDWYEERRPANLPPMEAPREALVIDVFETTEISLSLTQPGERLRGGPLFPHLRGRPADLGFVLVHYDRCAARIVASASPNSRAIVSTECWLERGQYLAVPLCLHGDRGLVATWACFSSRKVHLAHRQLSQDQVKHAWAAYVLDRDPTGTRFYGASLHIGRGTGGSAIALARNPAVTRMHFKTGLTFHDTTRCLQYTRGIPATSDWLAPGQGQILNFAQPVAGHTGEVGWYTQHKFEMQPARPVGKPLHDPPVKLEAFVHMPFQLSSLGKQWDPCTQQACTLQ